jgi:hypothetical protein
VNRTARDARFPDFGSAQNEPSLAKDSTVKICQFYERFSRHVAGEMLKQKRNNKREELRKAKFYQINQDKCTTSASDLVAILPAADQLFKWIDGIRRYAMFMQAARLSA